MPPLRKRRIVSMIYASGITTEDDYLHLYYVTRSKKKGLEFTHQLFLLAILLHLQC